MAKKQIQINDLIFEKVKFRYDFYDRGRVRTRHKLMLDSFFPFELALAIKNQAAIRPISRTWDGYAISERVSNEMATKKLHISELITMLGYTKTDISKMLQAVKNKELRIVLVGLGGTGSNFLNWLYEMVQWTGKVDVLQNIISYDDDIFDVPNMLRIPFLPEYDNHTEEPYKVNCIPFKFWTIAANKVLKKQKLEKEDLTQTKIGPLRQTIIYGAPDIETRTYLSESSFTFFAATHRDGEYSIVENPDVDNDLMMETYGKINLSKFFMNHLSMTIDFLKYLGETNRAYGTPDKNVEVVRKDFDANFNVQLIDGFKAGAKKVHIVNEQHAINEIELGR